MRGRGRAGYTGVMTPLLLAVLLLAPAAQAASRRPALHVNLRLTGRPTPAQLARNLINGSGNVRALSRHLDALDREDPREYREWVVSLRLVAQEGAVLRHGVAQAHALLKNEVPLDADITGMSFEPGPPIPIAGQEDADGARQALAAASVEEAEPLAAAIILRAQGADELDRISAYEASADEAARRVKELRAHLAGLVGEKAVDENPAAAAAAPARPASAVVVPDIMNAPAAARPAPKPRREP